MVGKKLLRKAAIAAVLCVSFLTGCTKTASVGDTDKNKKIEIGITQIAEHPALDAVRKGFIDGLSEKGFKDGEKIKLDIKNAQGDFTVAQNIASDFSSKKKDLIFAIATPSAQSAFNATKEIPIVFSAVTDPVSAGLSKSLDGSGTNITGTSDMSPIDKQFEMLKAVLPNTKKVGVLYNTSEVNSQTQVDIAAKITGNLGIEIIKTGVTNVNEVSQALDTLVKKIDVLYVPADNLAASSMALITSKCMEKKIPIIGAEKAHVDAGALLTVGIDYYELGKQTAESAVQIFNGKNPGSIPITTLKNTQKVFNMASAKKLGISIPENLLKGAVIIGGEQ